jgi:hypothetical protein
MVKEVQKNCSIIVLYVIMFLVVRLGLLEDIILLHYPFIRDMPATHRLMM